VSRGAAYSGPTVDSVLDAIGATPLMRIEGVFAKLEFMNPSGSVKARIAKHMIDKAEVAGLLRPGDTIVEASSGNTGNALAMVAAAKGYRMVVVTPRGLSTERTAISSAFGAHVELVGDFYLDEAVTRARELGGQPGWFCPSQFESEWNVEENREWLGREILAQLPENCAPDALVVGVGTGGTLVGVGQAFRAINPNALIIGVEPEESCTYLCGERCEHLIQGIADGFVPSIIERHRDLIDDFVAVSGNDAVAEMKRLARDHGLLVGPSSGAQLLAAKRLRDTRPELHTVVTLFSDEGEKYLADHYSDHADGTSPPSP